MRDLFLFSQNVTLYAYDKRTSSDVQLTELGEGPTDINLFSNPSDQIISIGDSIGFISVIGPDTTPNFTIYNADNITVHAEKPNGDRLFATFIQEFHDGAVILDVERKLYGYDQSSNEVVNFLPSRDLEEIASVDGRIYSYVRGESTIYIGEQDFSYRIINLPSEIRFINDIFSFGDSLWLRLRRDDGKDYFYELGENTISQKAFGLGNFRVVEVTDNSIYYTSTSPLTPQGLYVSDGQDEVRLVEGSVHADRFASRGDGLFFVGPRAD